MNTFFGACHHVIGIIAMQIINPKKCQQNFERLFEKSMINLNSSIYLSNDVLSILRAVQLQLFCNIS